MMVFVKLFTPVVFLVCSSAFDNDLIPKALREFNLHNENVAVEAPALKGEENSYTEPPTNRKSYEHSPPGCPNSETLQSLMKILVHLSKQMEEDAAPNRDQLSQAIALYKEYLLSAKLTKENFALLKKLLTVERDLKKYSKKKEEAKITVTFELPVPSQPLCLNALEDIVETAHKAYAELKLNDVCRRSNSLNESPTSLANTGDRVPTLQDFLISTENSPLSVGPYEFDISNYLNNYGPGGTNPHAQNMPSVNNDIWSQLLKDPKIEDLSASGIPNDLISQLLQNEMDRNVNVKDYGLKDFLLPQLNPKQKKIEQTAETRNSLLLKILNKFKSNDSKYSNYHVQNLLNNRPFGKYPNIKKILQENLAYGKGDLGPPNGLKNMEHAPLLGEVDPTQDLLSLLLSSQDHNSISKSSSHLLNKLKTDDIKDSNYDLQNSQNNRPFGENSNVDKILQENLVYGKGDLGPPNGLKNMEHAPLLGEVDPTQDLLSQLLSSQDHNSISKPSSHLLNKLKTDDNKDSNYDLKNSQNGNFGENSNVDKILQENLVYGKGDPGPPNGLKNMEHVPPLGVVNPTQDLLSKLLSSQDHNYISKPKATYPNPLQDTPLVIEAVDTLQSNQVSNFLKPNLQDLNAIQFDKNYADKSPYDTNALSRILKKLKYATFLASNLNKQKKKLNNIPQQALHADNVIPNFYNNGILHSNKVSSHVSPYLNPTHENVFGQRPPGSDDQIVDMPETVYKLITEPNQTGVLELSYLLNRPKPMAEPFYFVKYKIPYETFALNFQKLLREQPLKPRSPEMFYKDLLIKSSLDIADSSNVLRTPQNLNIIDQVLKNGTLLDAKVIDDNSTHKFVEVSVKALPSDEEAVQLVDILDHQKETETENFKVSLADENIGGENDKYSYRSDGFKNNEKDDASKSLAVMDELRHKVKEISSPNFLQLHSDSAKGTNSPASPPPTQN